VRGKAATSRALIIPYVNTIPTIKIKRLTLLHFHFGALEALLFFFYSFCMCFSPGLGEALAYSMVIYRLILDG